jgi:8-oxo-dGTP pyrophosphatase MutT (NUDIX family)
MPNHHFHRLTLRVYGWLTNEQNQVLMSAEYLKGFGFTKFPGGGLEPGESLPAALEREFMEELGLRVQVGRHLHTTQELYESAFAPGVQVIAIYFQVSSLEPLPTHFPVGYQPAPAVEGSELFFWQPMAELTSEMLTFPTDRAFVQAMHNLNP